MDLQNARSLFEHSREGAHDPDIQMALDKILTCMDNAVTTTGVSILILSEEDKAPNIALRDFYGTARSIIQDK